MQFLERDWMRRADRARGRFRTFLLTVLVRFLSDRGLRRGGRQMAFEQQLVSIASLISDAERSYEPPATETPETIFMRQWATDLVRTVRQRLKDLCAKKDHRVWYELFKAAHADSPGRSGPSQQALAIRFRLTREQVRYALEQVRQGFLVLLRAEVADQVGSEAEIDEEIRELLKLLGR